MRDHDKSKYGPCKDVKRCATAIMIAATRSQTGATIVTPGARGADPWDQLAGTHRHHHHKSPRTSAGTDLERDMPVSATGDGTPHNADSPHSADARCRMFGAITGIIFGYSTIDRCAKQCLLSVSPTDNGAKTKRDRKQNKRKIKVSESKHHAVKRHLGSFYPNDLYERIDKIRKVRNTLAHYTSGVDETKTIAHSTKHKTYGVTCLECVRDETERCAIEFESVVQRYRNYGRVSGSRVRGI